MFIGEEGRMLLGHVAGPRFFPESIYDKLVKPDIAPVVNHYGQWIDAIFGNDTVPAANFDYSGKMVEGVLLGVIAGRYPGRTIEWDTAKGEVTNLPEANAFVNRVHRKF
jgi:hypothetical protein